MSHTKSSAVWTDLVEEHVAEIIPFPDFTFVENEEEKKAKPRIMADRTYLYYKGRKIPIGHLKKAGYEKLLRLLVKEIER
ncbi:MAG: hypothetical protein KKB53_04290 [Acidobacteria bacterium]|nr:hypothetical protein [Acidobacteriota bacterium]MCG2816056.1 hypothetical protein [Candidatus Aminicenantes bacterium]